MICTKCGFEQADGGLECQRCGVVFSLYRGPAAPAAEGSAAPPEQESMPAEAVVGTVPPRPAPASPTPAGRRRSAAYGEMSITAGHGAPSSFGPPFQLRGVLGDVFSIYFENFVAFVLMAAAVIAPFLGALLLISRMGRQGAGCVNSLTWVIRGVAITPLVTGAITYGVAQELRQREASIGDCLRHGFSSLGKVFVTSLLQGLAILLGYLVCLVPGLIAATTFAVAIPAALEEQPGTAAMSRSADLTRDCRLAVFGVLLIIGVIQFGLGAVAGRVMAMLAPGGPPINRLLLTQAISPLTTSLSATAAAVMYYRLRSAKDGIDVAALTSVFD